jgi:transcriptional regulator GlxA family with amidase domain
VPELCEQQQMKDRSAASRIGVMIYEGVEPIDIGGTVGVLSMARRILPALDIAVLAERAGPVTLAAGLVVMAPFAFETAPACDVTIVCGGPGWRAQVRNPAALTFLRGRPRETIASVCTGALVVAAAGLLDNLAATTRRQAVGSEPESPIDLLKTYAADCSAVPATVVDAGVVTGGGVSLAIDTTLYLLGRLYGEDVSAEVARIIEYDRAYAVNRQALPIVVTAS